MGRHKKIVEEPITDYIERPKNSKIDSNVYVIIDEIVNQLNKEYKYTENEWEEGAKVNTLRYLNMLKEEFKKRGM